MTVWCVSDDFTNECQDDVKPKEEVRDGVNVVATKHFAAYYTKNDDRRIRAASCASSWVAGREAVNSEPPLSLASEEAQNTLASQGGQHGSPCATCINPAAKIMRFRSRLAELTSMQIGLPPEQAWGGEIRTTALQLQKALQFSAEYIFAQFPLGKTWKDYAAPKAIAWTSSCWFSKFPHKTSQEKHPPRGGPKGVQGHFTVGFQMYNRDGKWSISNHHLEAVLGLWLWSLKQSEPLLGSIAEEHFTRSKMVVVEKSKRDDTEAALYLWVTQTRQVREYGDVDGISRPDNLSIPTSSLISRARSSKQRCGASRQTDKTGTENFTVLGIPTNGSTSLLQLMAQDVYTVFINRIAGIVGNLRGTGDPEDYLTLRDNSFSTASRATPFFELTNPHIDALANVLVSAGIATREEALMSIVPAFLRQMKLPLLDEEMVQNLLDWAKSLRRDLKFRKGAALITWMLPRCPARFHKQVLQCLGDLYRRAALSKKRDDREFGLGEMRDMKKRHSALASDRQIEDMLSCYEHLYASFHDRTPKAIYGHSEASHVLSEMRRRRESREKGTNATIRQEDLQWALTLNKRFYLPGDEDGLFEILTLAIDSNFPELIEDLWIGARPPICKFASRPPPLITALDLKCELETVHSLLDWPGIDVDNKDSRSGLGDGSRTPLVCAIEANRADVVCSILRRGAYLHQRNRFGMTPLHSAFRKSNEKMIRFLLGKGAVRHDTDGRGRTELHFAAESNSEAIVQWLLKEGANIHEKDKKGRTALHFAAKANGEAVIRLLLENKAEMHEKDDKGRTPLHVATKAQNKVTIPFLLKSGAKIHEKDDEGRTPLHIAASRLDSEEVIQLLLENEAQVYEKDWQGRTPLHLAADGYRSEKGTRLLLEYGAGVHDKDDKGRTPLHLAAAVWDNANTAQLLLKHGARVCDKDTQGSTPLHLAAGGFNGERAARLLLENGAMVDEKDEKGCTPLHIQVATCGWRSDEVARLLLEKGADIYEEDKEGRTALHVAVQHGNQSALRLLLEKSAEIGSVSDRGWSSLWSVIPRSSEEMAQVLEEKGIEKPLDFSKEEGGEEEKGKEEEKEELSSSGL